MIANALFSRQSKAKGFTLLELLIVITILAILAVIIIFVLNPAETLKKSRDVQRLSDLATLKNAISLYTTTVNPTILDGVSSANNVCVGGTGDDGLWVSVPNDSPGEEITDTIGAGFPASNPVSPPHTSGSFIQLAVANIYNIGNGSGSSLGWIPVDLGKITGGSPISNFPVDPTNDVSVTTGSDTSTAAIVNNGALMYRYTCGKSSTTYEIDARLESAAFGTSSTDDNKAAKDGGNNSLLYEVGTDLTLLPAANDF